MARKKNKRVVPSQAVSKRLQAAYAAAIIAGVKILRKTFQPKKDIMLSELVAGNLAPAVPVVGLHFPLNAEEIAKKHLDILAANNRKIFQNAIKSMTGTSPILPEKPVTDLLSGYIAENVRLIKSIPVKLHGQVSDLIHGSFQTAMRPETLSKLIEERFDVAESRARLIAVDQLAKLNGDISRQNSQDIGCEYYTWSTVQDERVRDEPDESHRAMEGMLCRWDDDTVYSDDGGETWNQRSDIGGPELDPGEDYRCRCVSLSVLPDTDKLKAMEDPDAPEEVDPLQHLQNFIDSQNMTQLEAAE